MSNKNKINGKKIALVIIIVVGGFGAVIGFPLISGLGEILPELPENFEIPFVDPEDPMKEQEEVKDEIDDIIDQPVVFCSADSAELLLFAQCELKTQGEVVVISPPIGIDPDTFEPCSGINPTTVQDCSLEIEERINELLGTLEPEPEPEVPPEGSEDPPAEQLCDIEPDNPLCGTILPDPSSVSLVTQIVKVSSSGERFEVSETFNVPLASLFVEDTTNIDFRNGFIEIELFAESEPEVQLTGIGKFDILIGQTSIFATPLEIKIQGMTDIDGRIPITIISPAGNPSNDFRLDIGLQFDKFTNNQITDIKININQLDIQQIQVIQCVTTPCDPIVSDFTVSDITLFTMGILRDDIRLIIEDEEGTLQRVFPSDSRVVVLTKNSRSEEYFTGRIRYQAFDSTFYGNGQGCSRPFITSDRTFTASTSNFATVPAPTISGVSITDKDNNILASSASGAGVVLDFNQLTRNQTYALKISTPSVSGDLVYGQAQETKTATCVQQGTVITKTTSTTYGDCNKACGSCATSIYQVFGSLKLGAITCELPTE